MYGHTEVRIKLNGFKRSSTWIKRRWDNRRGYNVSMCRSPWKRFHTSTDKPDT